MSDDDSMAHQSGSDSDLNVRPPRARAGRQRQGPIDMDGRNAIYDSDSNEDNSDAEVGPALELSCCSDRCQTICSERYGLCTGCSDRQSPCPPAVLP